MEFEFNKVDPESDLTRFIEMMKLSLNMNPHPDYFNWKYLRNPAGKLVAFEAKHQDKSAGFYGIIPEWYEINGEEKKVYQSMDTMTHPDFRRKGLFTRLAKMTYQHVEEKENGVVIMGIPGMNSLPGFVRKLDWKLIHQFSYVFLNRTVHKLRSAFNKKYDLEFLSINRFDTSFDSFYESKYQSKQIRKKLSSEFLNWKICDHPYFDFKALEINHNSALIGYLIYRIDGKGRCFIEYFDLMKQQDLVKYGASVIKKLFQFSGTQFIYTWQPICPVLQNFYKSNGFLINPFNKGPFSYRVPLINYSAGQSDGRWQEVENYDLQPIIQD